MQWHLLWRAHIRLNWKHLLLQRLLACQQLVDEHRQWHQLGSTLGVYQHNITHTFIHAYVHVYYSEKKFLITLYVFT